MLTVRAKLALSSLPLLVTLGGWKCAVFLNSFLGCTSIGKDPEPCMVAGFNIQSGLAFFAWYGLLLWMPALIVSGLLLGKTFAAFLPRPWGSRAARQLDVESSESRQ